MEIPISQFIEMFGDPVENPKDFDKCPLMSLAKKITDGVHKKPVYTKTGKPFISVTNINRGVIDFTDCKFVSEEAYQTMIKTTYPERGDVLYTKVGATYGIPAYVDTDEQFGLYVSVCLIKPKHDLIDARFLTESMRMEYIKKQADDRIKGIGVPDLHLQEIKSFEVLCPPRELQEQFVAFVQQSDKSKFACLKSQFIEMFGDPFENPKGYVKKTIGDVCDFQGGSQPPRKEFVFKPQEGYVRLIQIRDYKTDDYITYAPEKMCRRFCDADDIMIGRYGPPIFQILQGIEGAYNVALMKAIPHGINKEFMRAYLKRDELLHHLELFSTRTAGQSGIEMSELRGYPCLVPPEEEQLQYVEFVKQSDKSKLCFHLHTTTLHYAHS